MGQEAPRGSQEEFKARGYPSSVTALMPLPSPPSSATRGKLPGTSLGVPHGSDSQERRSLVTQTATRPSLKLCNPGTCAPEAPVNSLESWRVGGGQPLGPPPLLLNTQGNCAT